MRRSIVTIENKRKYGNVRQDKKKKKKKKQQRHKDTTSLLCATKLGKKRQNVYIKVTSQGSNYSQLFDRALHLKGGE